MHAFTSSYTLRMSEKFPVHVPAALHWDSRGEGAVSSWDRVLHSDQLHVPATSGQGLKTL